MYVLIFLHLLAHVNVGMKMHMCVYVWRPKFVLGSSSIVVHFERILKLNSFICMSTCLCVSMCGHLMGSVLSFQHAGARVQTQVMWLGSKGLYPLIHLSGPSSPLFCVESGSNVEHGAGQFQLIHLGIKNKTKQSLTEVLCVGG